MQTTLTAPAYSYQQFSDDTDINAFFEAYNQLAQEGLSWMLERKLALWTSPELTGGLLKYALYCVYGQTCPSISLEILRNAAGALNDEDVNRRAIEDMELVTSSLKPGMSDDLLKRIATWNFYKADGFNFTIPWLKRRVMRFLMGTGGAAHRFNTTLPVSVTLNTRGGTRNVQITVGKGPWAHDLVTALNSLLAGRHLHLPTMCAFALKDAS